MNFSKFNINDIISEYDKTRLNNKRILQERQAEIYDKIPRIEEIDIDTKTSYLSVARQRILGQDPDKTITEATSKKNRLQRQEKLKLLLDAGYPEDYLEPVYTCRVCQDTGYVDTNRCDCFMDKLSRALYLQSNLTNILDVENFNTFDFDYYSKDIPEGYDYSPHRNITNVIRLSKEFVERFKTSDSNRGNIFIYGEIGMGKTFLTNCIAKELLDSGHKVLYLSANELFNEVLAPFIINNKKELEDLYNYVYNCELLIIDDLGTELVNSFTQSQLFEIINQRSKLGRAVLISSNKNLQQIKDTYSERIASRIIEGYTIFNIFGDSVRYKKRFNK